MVEYYRSDRPSRGHLVDKLRTWRHSRKNHEPAEPISVYAKLDPFPAPPPPPMVASPVVTEKPKPTPSSKPAAKQNVHSDPFYTMSGADYVRMTGRTHVSLTDLGPSTSSTQPPKQTPPPAKPTTQTPGGPENNGAARVENGPSAGASSGDSQARKTTPLPKPSSPARTPPPRPERANGAHRTSGVMTASPGRSTSPNEMSGHANGQGNTTPKLTYSNSEKYQSGRPASLSQAELQRSYTVPASTPMQIPGASSSKQRPPSSHRQSLGVVPPVPARPLAPGSHHRYSKSWQDSSPLTAVKEDGQLPTSGINSSMPLKPNVPNGNGIIQVPIPIASPAPLAFPEPDTYAQPQSLPGSLPPIPGPNGSHRTSVPFMAPPLSYEKDGPPRPVQPTIDVNHPGSSQMRHNTAPSPQTMLSPPLALERRRSAPSETAAQRASRASPNGARPPTSPSRSQSTRRPDAPFAGLGDGRPNGSLAGYTNDRVLISVPVEDPFQCSCDLIAIGPRSNMSAEYHAIHQSRKDFHIEFLVAIQFLKEHAERLQAEVLELSTHSAAVRQSRIEELRTTSKHAAADRVAQLVDLGGDNPTFIRHDPAILETINLLAKDRSDWLHAFASTEREAIETRKRNLDGLWTRVEATRSDRRSDLKELRREASDTRKDRMRAAFTADPNLMNDTVEIEKVYSKHEFDKFADVANAEGQILRLIREERRLESAHEDEVDELLQSAHEEEIKFNYRASDLLGPSLVLASMS